MKGNENSGGGAPRGARLEFGILMILVYVGIGILLILNRTIIPNTAISCVIGGLLCAYGVWRAVRLYKGWN